MYSPKDICAALMRCGLEIRELTKNDAIKYRGLRLRALKEHPTAFSSSYEEQKDRPLEVFAQRLPSTPDTGDSFTLGCFDDEKLIGSVGVYREQGLKRMHVGVIVGMHVVAERQDRGYGRALLQAALARVRKVHGLSHVRLSVESTNEQAKSLYRSLGFESYGIEREALFVDGEYFDEELLALRLDSPTG